MTISLTSETDWPSLEGRQEPQHLLRDDGDQSEVDKAITLATRVKRAQLPWQKDTLSGTLTLDPDGMLTHPTVIIIAPRQNGKTLSAAELRMLYGAYERHETIVYSAQRWLTAKSIHLRMKALINSRPSLKRRTSGWLCSQGVAGFTVHHDDGTENVVMFITRSGEFRGPDKIDLVIYDEAYNLTDSSMAAIGPTQLAAPNPQTIYLSSAVNEDKHSTGDVLARLRQRALKTIRAGQRRTGVYFAEYMAPGPDEGLSDQERRVLREDPETWKLANPSYGVIHSEAKVRKLLAELSTVDFEVEVLGWGRWPKPEVEPVKVVSPAVWQSCADEDVELVGSRVIGLALAPDRRTWAVAAAQRTVDGRVFGEIGMWQAATHDEVIRFISAAIADWDPAAVVMDSRSLSMVLASKLEAIGVEPVRLTTPAMAQACGTLLDDIDSGAFCHGGQPELDLAARVVQKRLLPQGDFVLDCGQESAPMVAIALAHQGVLRFASKPTQRPAAAVSGLDADRAWVTGANIVGSAKSQELDLLSVAF